MQDLTCDDCNLMNNGNSSNIKTIDPCAVSISTSTVDCVVGNKTFTGAIHTSNEQHYNKNNNKNNNISSNNECSKPLLRSIKLEDAQNNSNENGCFFTSSSITTNKLQPSGDGAVKSDNATTPWPTTHSMFKNVEAAAATISQQRKQNHQHVQQHQHNHQYHQHHHHHQLLLHGSDDPLISHGADSVINDDDHGVELKHLLTAATNGKTHHQQQTNKQQQQAENQKIHLRNHHQSPLTYMSNATELIQKRPPNGCSSLTKQQLKMKAGLMSAAQQQQQQQQQLQAKQTSYHNFGSCRTSPTQKPAKSKAKNKFSSSTNTVNGSGTLKLRFHHQALPPEYLSHYEATQRQVRQNIAAINIPQTPSIVLKEAASNTRSATANATAVKVAQTAKLPPPKSSHENVRSWLQKIAEIQRAAQQQQQQQQRNQPTSKLSSNNIPTTSSTPHHDANNNHQSCRMTDLHSPLIPTTTSVGNYERISAKAVPHSVPTTSGARIVNYADLPYMGEITLNNSKPRRGRKPKKADICHLIYKNYGTIFPDINKNPLISNSQREELLASKLESQQHDMTAAADEEPLNLCLRDYQNLDLYSVSSGEDNGNENDDDGDVVEEGDDNVSVSGGDTNSNCTTPGDVITDTLLATNMKTAMPCLGKPEDRKPFKTELKIEEITPQDAARTDESTNVLLRPVRAYYQKLLESGILLNHHGGTTKTTTLSTFAGLPIETIEKDNQIALKIPIPSGFFVASKIEQTKTPNTSSNTNGSTLTPLEYPEPLSTPSSIKSEQSFTTTTTSSNVTGGGVTSNQSNSTPQKRKRSAIFIPPMPAENGTNPPNEVSICKFKFTGGIKPTLQEKKMLSVDSDGNYRYYSGTGDKSMRGYEFFPRESLQQSGFLPGGVGGAGAFLNATGEKISTEIPPPSSDLSNELLQIPDSPTGTLLLPAPGSMGATVTTHSAGGINCGGGGGGGSNSSASNHGLLTISSQELNLRTKAKNQHITSHDHNSSINESNPFMQRKKRSPSVRRTTQREKLERTFKEKGFLIQTQQLESAEGATYCKFRQLKKFTRYLFRNWKDYLPDGQVQQHLSSQGIADVADQQSTIDSLLSGHGLDEHQTEFDNGSSLKAAEVLCKEVLPSFEKT